MRKEEYTMLAYAIRKNRDIALNKQAQDPERGAYFEGYALALSDIARQFADRASVDRTEFLKACGLK